MSIAKISSTTFFDPEFVDTPELTRWQAESNRAVTDLGKFWSSDKAATIDVSWLLSYQQKNIEALTAANQRAFEAPRPLPSGRPSLPTRRQRSCRR